MAQSTYPAGIRSLAISIPTETREITLPSGRSALRHSMPQGISGLEMEREAADEALKLAGMDPRDVDLLISASFPALPEPCIGNATPLAYEMGMEKAACYNIESACAGGLLALRSACQEIRTGEYENVLVSVACPYSPTIEAGHPATDVIGDAAHAMVVGRTRPEHDFLGCLIRNSGPTCPVLSWGADPRTPSGIRLNVGATTAGKLEDWAHLQLPELCDELFDRTGLSREQVDHWVLNAATESFAPKAMKVMGAQPDDGVNINRIAGNIGPALVGVALFYNALMRDFQPGDVVLCCSVGSKASLALSLMRWPEDVRLGSVPPNAPVETLRGFEAERLGR